MIQMTKVTKPSVSIPILTEDEWIGYMRAWQFYLANIDGADPIGATFTRRMKALMDWAEIMKFPKKWEWVCLLTLGKQGGEITDDMNYRGQRKFTELVELARREL